MHVQQYAQPFAHRGDGDDVGRVGGRGAVELA